MSLILPHIDLLPAYVPGAYPPDGSSALKLNQNENPYPPSPLVLQALVSTAADSLKRYPEAGCSELRMALGCLFRMPKENIFIGNGSSEIISIIMKVFVGCGNRLALPDPTFSLYESVAAAYQAECLSVPVASDFRVHVDDLLEAGSKAKAVVLVNPNAPTGKLLELNEVERLVRGFPGVVVVDEAYMDFAEPGMSAVQLVERHENLVVVRSFSKSYGLCGARVGYAFAGERLIRALEKGKDLYNVNALSRKLALAALSDQAYMEQTVAAVQRTREAFTSRLREIGFLVVPSQTNFVLCAPPAGDGRPTARELYDRLLERDIYVRYSDHPRLIDKLRISIGTDREMERLSGELQLLCD